MKVKITRKDGVIIEADGTAEECQKLLPAEIPQFTLNPLQFNAPVGGAGGGVFPPYKSIDGILVTS